MGKIINQDIYVQYVKIIKNYIKIIISLFVHVEYLFVNYVLKITI